MKATKNLVHALVLGTWALLGVWLTLKGLVGAGGLTVLSAIGFWLWLGGLAAVTSLLVAKVESAIGALAVHATAFFCLSLLPSTLPFSVLRLGLDLVHKL
jgi:hypothetical protein